MSIKVINYSGFVKKVKIVILDAKWFRDFRADEIGF